MHFDVMKQRYASMRALPDFYARGLGWVQDRLDLVLTVIIAGDIVLVIGFLVAPMVMV
jgi:hypothetical protein